MDVDIAEYPCVNCTERLGFVHIECAKCEELRLCLECFSCGAELSSHERTHPYRVKNAQGKCIFVESNISGSAVWRAAEEMALLEAVERFNLGNWNDVVNNVNKSRTPKELRDHYDKFYLRGKIGSVTRKNLKLPLIRDHSESISNKSNSENREGALRANADDLTMIAYMPNRDDFEKEYNNDAETVISNLVVIQDDDEELDRSLKLALIDGYIRQLAERKRRKELIHSYNLIEKFVKQEKPQQFAAYSYAPNALKRLKNERELKDNLRKFTQLLPVHEFDDLVAGLIKEKALKERISHLEELQKSGITRIKDGGNCGIVEPFSLSDFESKANEVDQKSTFTQKLRLRKEEKAENLDSALERTAISDDGIECDAYKNDTPKADSKKGRLAHPQNLQLLLSESEKDLCRCCSLTERDYVLLKASLLKEQICKNNGVPLRKNDVSTAKENVKDFMTSSGWIPAL